MKYNKNLRDYEELKKDYDELSKTSEEILNIKNELEEHIDILELENQRLKMQVEET